LKKPLTAEIGSPNFLEVLKTVLQKGAKRELRAKGDLR